MVKSSRAEDADPGSHFQGGEEEKSPYGYDSYERFLLLDSYPTPTLRYPAVYQNTWFISLKPIELFYHFS